MEYTDEVFTRAVKHLGHAYTAPRTEPYLLRHGLGIDHPNAYMLYVLYKQHALALQDYDLGKRTTTLETFTENMDLLCKGLAHFTTVRSPSLRALGESKINQLQAICIKAYEQPSPKHVLRSGKTY